MNTYYVGGFPKTDELYHHGIKGQKWGIRRFQNEDGSYTEAGLKRYGRKDSRTDLGYTTRQRLNNVQTSYVERYRGDTKGYMKNTKRSQKAVTERRKKEYESEAKAFLSKSETVKAMNTYYNSLLKSDKKSIDREYKSMLINTGKAAAHQYLDNEMLKRKVASDRQGDIWERTR